MMKTRHGNDEVFMLKVHNGWLPSHLLFMDVTEVLTYEVSYELPWEALWV